MSKVIIFSTKYPSTHPRRRELTYFPDQIYNCLYPNSFFGKYTEWFTNLNPNISLDIITTFQDTLNFDENKQKKHTIRGGNRWKAGDKFSPRVWSGLPYKSKQIILAPDIEIKRISSVMIDGFLVFIDKERVTVPEEVAFNDGFKTFPDFINWFPMKVRFHGQLIVWDDFNLPY